MHVTARYIGSTGIPVKGSIVVGVTGFETRSSASCSETKPPDRELCAGFLLVTAMPQWFKAAASSDADKTD